ncbi:hypothetical protein D031_0470B, partial [Vibrio parahaemolyticus VP-48]
NINWLICV